MSVTRKRVYSIMNKERLDFQSTPSYDEFLEDRENLINKFVHLNDTSGASMVNGVSGSPLRSREDLDKILHKFEVDNQEHIIRNRTMADEKKKQKLEEIIETEGTLYDRINVDYGERDSVIDHELAIQYAELLASSSTSNDQRLSQHASADVNNRRTRLISKPSTSPSGMPSFMLIPMIVHASGCKDLWKRKSLEAVTSAFAIN